MISWWYTREYLGKSFDNFLKSEMNSNDFKHLLQVLQRVSEQLRVSSSFIESGYPNKIGKIPIKPKGRKEMSY